MEVALSGPPRRGTPLPLGPLLEERGAGAPNRPLRSKIYAKLKSTGLVRAEPPELHFSGFELQKDYVKTLRLINVSSEVVNLRVVPTRAEHFRTSGAEKCRLVPGLAHALKVTFRPDEWRYFYDSVRVHCKGEEDLLIPVHGYPVIDDLRVPPRIDLPAAPLGQSVRHAIPLRCSCPVDFEFQVHVIEPHEAFSVHPLSGVIPANGEVKIIVTFSPTQYETSQVTIQLVLSQFNTRPYVCTITGSSAPRLALSELRRTWAHEAAPDGPRPPPASKGPPRRKTRDKSKVHVEPGPKPPVDVWTPAGVAKMLIQDTSKLSAKDLKEAGGNAGLQDRRVKEAVFLKKVQQNVKEEQDNHIRWQVRLGKDPVSQRTRREVAEEREMALHQYMVKTGGLRHEEEFAAGRPQLSSQRLLCEAGQACEGTPSFQFYSSFPWELRRRALALFQQAARKVVIRCRMNRRLSRLRRRSDSMTNLPSAQKDEDETTRVPNIPPDRVLPFAFPVFPDDDLLVSSNLETVPVDPIDATVTTIIPFFRLQVPQHYKLMGYQPPSAWEAFDSYIPTALARPLRTGAPLKDELLSNEDGDCSPTGVAAEARQEDDEEAANLTFSAPEALLRPPPANPLRIFNPAPGLWAYKPTPKYQESDLEFHLCPLPRFPIHKNHNQKKFPDRKELITGLMKWREFYSITSDCLSEQPAVTMAVPRTRVGKPGCLLNTWASHASHEEPSWMRGHLQENLRGSSFHPSSRPRSHKQQPTSSRRRHIIGGTERRIDYSTDTLPPPPPPLAGPPDDLTPLKDKQCEGSGVQLTPEMIRAQFLSPVSNSNLSRGATARHQETSETGAEFNQMGKRVTTKLKRLADTASRAAAQAEHTESVAPAVPLL